MKKKQCLVKARFSKLGIVSPVSSRFVIIFTIVGVPYVFQKCRLMVHCDFEKGSQNHHFQSKLVRREGVIKCSTLCTLFSLDNVDNSGQPITFRVLDIHMRMTITKTHTPA